MEGAKVGGTCWACQFGTRRWYGVLVGPIALAGSAAPGYCRMGAREHRSSAGACCRDWRDLARVGSTQSINCTSTQPQCEHLCFSRKHRKRASTVGICPYYTYSHEYESITNHLQPNHTPRTGKHQQHISRPDSRPHRLAPAAWRGGANMTFAVVH